MYTGPPADHPQSSFTDSITGVRITVADYFTAMSRRADNNYRTLQYPSLPTVDVGTKQRPIYMPVELVIVPPGQIRQRDITGDITAQLIKYAAVKPNDRFLAISKNSKLFPALLADEDVQRCGLATLTSTTTTTTASSENAMVPTSSSSHYDNAISAAATLLPMRVVATILPPAKLQYGNDVVIRPEQTGSWNLINNATFVHPAPATTTTRCVTIEC